MRQKNIDKIRAECIRVNPEIEGKHLFEDGYAQCKFCDVYRIVLLALGLDNFHNNDKIPELVYGYRHSWNLIKDDLTLQSDETLQFIADLLPDSTKEV